MRAGSTIAPSLESPTPTSPLSPVPAGIVGGDHLVLVGAVAREHAVRPWRWRGEEAELAVVRADHVRDARLTPGPEGVLDRLRHDLAVDHRARVAVALLAHGHQVQAAHEIAPRAASAAPRAPRRRRPRRPRASRAPTPGRLAEGCPGPGSRSFGAAIGPPARPPPDSQIALWNRPFASGDVISVFTEPPPADSPKIVTLLGSPPKRRDVLAAPTGAPRSGRGSRSCRAARRRSPS